VLALTRSSTASWRTVGSWSPGLSRPPAIAARSYEVDPSFRALLVSYYPANERFFSDGPADKPHFDLEAYVAFRLAAAGLKTIETLGLDTYSLPERYFSYRRATHRGEPDYGRQISLIGLPS